MAQRFARQSQNLTVVGNETYTLGVYLIADICWQGVSEVILSGNRLRFVSAKAGRHATELVAERLHGIARQRWLLTQAAG
ncbi:TPA: hypothetical protein N3509_000225 [Klebsiella pneumoniae]|nr:hypothetical protein [Klebsiella pneumoniae]